MARAKTLIDPLASLRSAKPAKRGISWIDRLPPNEREAWLSARAEFWAKHVQKVRVADWWRDLVRDYGKAGCELPLSESVFYKWVKDGRPKTT